MQVSVRLFAGLREIMGSELLDVELEGDSATVQILREALSLKYPKLHPYLTGVAIAVNEEYILSDESELTDGDSVALVPPIAGGSLEVLVTTEILTPAKMRQGLEDDKAGAVVIFEGVVRNHHEGRNVVRLEYEAYEEMATKQLASVRGEILEYFQDQEVYKVYIWHRIGVLEVGEVSLLVGVCAAHRADAFEAALRAVDRVKETVPIWKKEWSADGSHWQEGVMPRP